MRKGREMDSMNQPGTSGAPERGPPTRGERASQEREFQHQQPSLESPSSVEASWLGWCSASAVRESGALDRKSEHLEADVGSTRSQGAPVHGENEPSLWVDQSPRDLPDPFLVFPHL